MAPALFEYHFPVSLIEIPASKNKNTGCRKHFQLFTQHFCIRYFFCMNF